jgi:colanic acid/amylovoran biosynthesis glycosyltransferase
MSAGVALQRCDTFVGRTMNWLYDHLRAVPRYTPLVLCDRLAHRDEFPELEAWALPSERLGWRVWRKVVGDRLYPPFARRLRRRGPRLLHSHFGYVAETDLALHRALEVPWLIAFYGADVYELGRDGEWRDRYLPMFAQATRILALGPAMAAALAQLGCPADKIDIHALGVDTAALPQRARALANGDPLRLLFAGTFREKKGVEYVIEAAHLARAAGVRFELHLVGDAFNKPGDQETKAEIFRRIGRYELQDVVTHHSWLPFQDLLALALRCHVFVAPSVTARDGDAEGTPFVIQQMMATAMPVITTVHSDIPFVFGDLASQLVPERDARAIADRLVAYRDEPARLTRDGQAQAAQMRAHFDLRHRAAALADLYDRVS